MRGTHRWPQRRQRCVSIDSVLHDSRMSVYEQPELTPEEDARLPPVLLGEMRIVAQGGVSGTVLGARLTEDFRSKPREFIKDLQRLEEKWMDRQIAMQSEPAPIPEKVEADPPVPFPEIEESWREFSEYRKHRTEFLEWLEGRKG